MDDSESQEDELLALTSIYDDHTFVCSHGNHAALQPSDGHDRQVLPPSGHFTAHLQLPQPFTVSLKKSNNQEQQYTVQHLPPVQLHFELPVTYPSTSAPNFTIAAKWLTHVQLSRLCARLDEIAQENQGEVVLFLWTSFLQDETLEFLQVESPLDLNNVVSHGGKHRTLNEEAMLKSQNTQSSQTTALKICDRDLSLEASFGLPASNDIGQRQKSHSKSFKNCDYCDETCDCLSQKSNDTRKDLDINTGASSKSLDPRAVQDIASPDMLLAAILDHDRKRRDHVFRNTLFTCHVCFLEKLGEACIKFIGCEHVYCRECMTGYFELQIREGAVSALTCPSDDCGTQALPTQVRCLVDSALYSRYERLLLQHSLDTMSDVMYCPRTSCGSAVVLDQDNNTGSCPLCYFVFCVFCKKVYHGVAPCRMQPAETKKIREQYENGGDDVRRMLEKRYGRAMIRGLIEDSYTNEWLSENSKQCPSCSTHIQKVDGCNKMTCTKCRAHFCWLCGAHLSRSNPYLHFNQLNSECFNRLFAGVVIDNGGWEEEEELEFWN